MHLLRSQAPQAYDRLRIILVGVDDTYTQSMVQASGVADRVTLTGYQPHDVSVAWVRWADALFLPLDGLPRKRRSLIVPGKTYEYLASGRPILAAVPEGDARDLVLRAGGTVTPPTDHPGLASALSKLVAEPPSDEARSARAAWVDGYRRPALTRRLFTFLDGLLSQMEL